MTLWCSGLVEDYINFIITKILDLWWSVSNPIEGDQCYVTATVLLPTTQNALPHEKIVSFGPNATFINCPCLQLFGEIRQIEKIVLIVTYSKFDELLFGQIFSPLLKGKSFPGVDFVVIVVIIVVVVRVMQELKLVAAYF